MTQTRGRPTSRLLGVGGFVRSITPNDVGAALGAAGYSGSDGDWSRRLSDLFQTRMISVDNPPVTTREGGRRVDKIRNAARRLSEAPRDYENTPRLLREAERAVHDDHLRAEDLHKWIATLERLDVFHPYQPSNDYRVTIRRARHVIGEAGGNIGTHPNCQLLRFLNALEDKFPKLIFPPHTVPSGRYKYLENAVKEG